MTENEEVWKTTAAATVISNTKNQRKKVVYHYRIHLLDGEKKRSTHIASARNDVNQ